MNLAEIYCFEPRTAFKRIDRTKNYSISAYEIVDFLRDNGIYATIDDAKTLVAAYDGDKDDRLDYKEFEKMILPATDYSLKMRAYGRPE
jgi:Ca2+-binding EF-hand superfamily protein